ncbi:hypothetical protein OG592_41310 (plasmid) [Streptomyces avidinii]|uniref:hypothetical protein n=1 Tax=Streptomyces avidinii TaxID=1895 RepID=UPI002F90CC1E|nr:hypothetical protein OG592_41310 [Streptomyces avidinii]
MLEELSQADLPCGFKQSAEPFVSFFDVFDQVRQQRLALPGAVGLPPVDLAPALGETLEVLWPDRARSHPGAPALGSVHAEAPHRAAFTSRSVSAPAARTATVSAAMSAPWS